MIQDVLINEKSLDGQFADAEDFAGNGVIPFILVYNEIREYPEPVFLKKYDFYDCPVTPQDTLSEVLGNHLNRKYDAIRKYKNILFQLINTPFWQDTQQHSTTALYQHKNVCVNDTSIAETEARNGVMISFIHTDFAVHPVVIQKDANTVDIDNIWLPGQFCEILYRRGLINFESFVKQSFKGGKIDFSGIKPKYGFNLIEKVHEALFFDGFRKFNDLSWPSILVDDALSYKDFKKNRNTKPYFSAEEWNKGIKKFSISDKFRCFGYAEKDVFHVLRFDLGHKLSDLG